MNFLILTQLTITSFGFSVGRKAQENYHVTIGSEDNSNFMQKQAEGDFVVVKTKGCNNVFKKAKAEIGRNKDETPEDYPDVFGNAPDSESSPINCCNPGSEQQCRRPANKGFCKSNDDDTNIGKFNWMQASERCSKKGYDTCTLKQAVNDSLECCGQGCYINRHYVWSKQKVENNKVTRENFDRDAILRSKVTFSKGTKLIGNVTFISEIDPTGNSCFIDDDQKSDVQFVLTGSFKHDNGKETLLTGKGDMTVSNLEFLADTTLTEGNVKIHKDTGVQGTVMILTSADTQVEFDYKTATATP
jgi:hypothetical protein